MNLSVVIPALNEAEYIGACLHSIRREFAGELLVVDGGSRDRTRELAAPWVTRVLSSDRGLARQANAGVEVASGDVLFFMAADCIAPAGWLADITMALSSPYVSLGGFRLELDDSSPVFRLLEWGGNFRSRYLRLALPDQGLFIRRRVFEAVGRFDESSLIPYARLCLTLPAGDELKLLDSAMRSSARKWHQGGVLRTTLTHMRRYLRFRRREIPPWR